MSRAVLSIGSNMGDRLAQLRSVVAGLGERVVAVSPVYSTAPWGGVDQDDFLNAVVVAEDPALDGWGWLRLGQEFERAAHRVREVRWGARTLDVDVVTCAERGAPVVSADPELTLPHPQAHNRAFVLIPWLDVDPGAHLAADGADRPIRDWLAALDPAERAGVHRTEFELREVPERGDRVRARRGPAGRPA
ncbi:2-amino-4-hydroxy-6-hydroxymethyldihydropteridine diphosphokinase [Nocardia puris]|uniref:2-amino-4-hydroxy-6-hydroxymethyldihydropteridine diphosphokinase n=1 Tax=Nocardia puris TaxID=208602 RepID=A0A366DBD9_9NOCA|nr:2-amino-4-hydroxy-6-hydroxymethyldihydropteridine diphosphokinase [Nocardia puris]MBF6214582.1 2-amino-4-hydroxy-6-hydroxymethyldihydropteridine diphosphokinase [Nocardia puris]MBF6365991.1 2-amino-4-hydroxy-6-hydroxymethyldihydropteridine diphosphokinase [Nocardia puris]MBF6460366.1 2-amino-4-hydroxy-6-hydroxymethyldihydropteridine diphosphokinase [Nocardia puris]RBO87360.1 2-amino-4-hydroxy-6-hydroxymethyldihydropteridine diphosphokinase [Nocardia puris]